MDVFKLMEKSFERIDQEIENTSLSFTERSETTRSMLRALGVLPLKRADMSNRVHMSLAVMLMTAVEDGETVDVTSRRQQDLHDKGITTMLFSWLDKAVDAGVLLSKDGANGARGKLYFTDRLIDVLNGVKE